MVAGRRLGHVVGQPGSDLVELLDLAGAVDLPQPVEAPQLTLQVARRLAEPLQPQRRPVGRVQLHQGVDQLVGDAGTVLGAVQRRGELLGDDRAADALHDVERRADHLEVVADRQDSRGADRGRLQRGEQARLAQDVVGAGRQRPPRRPAQDDIGGEPEGDVGVPVADRHGAEVAAAPRGRWRAGSHAVAPAPAGARGRWPRPRRGWRRCRLGRAWRSSVPEGTGRGRYPPPPAVA